MGILDQGRRKTIAIGVLLAFTWTGMSWATEQGIADAQKTFAGFSLVASPAGADANYSFSLSLTKESNAVTLRQVIGAVQLRSGGYLALVDGQLMDFDRANFIYDNKFSVFVVPEKAQGVASAMVLLMQEAFHIGVAVNQKDENQSLSLFKEGVNVGWYLRFGGEALYKIDGKFYQPSSDGGIGEPKELFDFKTGRPKEGLTGLAERIANDLKGILILGKEKFGSDLKGLADYDVFLIGDEIMVRATFDMGSKKYLSVDFSVAEVEVEMAIKEALASGSQPPVEKTDQSKKEASAASRLTPDQAKVAGSLLEMIFVAPIAAAGAALRAAFSGSQTPAGNWAGGGGGKKPPSEADANFVADAFTTPGEAVDGNGYHGIPSGDVTARNAAVEDREEKKLVEDFKTKFTLQKGSAGDYSFQYAVVSDADLSAFCKLNNISFSYLCFLLNKRDIFVQNDRSGFYEGQEKVVRKADKIESIFAVSKFYAYYWDGKSLWIYSQKKGMFSQEFSTFAKITFTDLKDARMTGLALLAFARFAATEGLSKDQFVEEMAFLRNNFGVAWTDENGVIVDKLFNRSQFRLADGRPGVFTVTGQIDPTTKKGYNWATVHNGNTYAGLGGDMVDIKSLLTRAEYRDLALAILNNKSLMVETIVRVTGCWLLQHGKLPGVSEEIKKFLDYDTSQAPNGFNFDVVDGKVVVKPL